MKISELKLIIKEEIADLFNSDAPKAKYSEGDKLNYRGIPYTVVSDSGYVVTVVDSKGKESAYNHNQLSQGVFRKPVNEEGEMGVTLEELPKFNKLPEKELDGSVSITLPSIKTADAGIIIYSKVLARKWENNFINKWGLAPGEEKVRFSSKNIPLKIVNASDKYNKWKAGEIMTKGAAYDKLGSYKGD